MIKRLALDKYSALYLWAAFIIIFGLARPGTFLTWTSFKSVLIENVIYGVLAIAFLIPLSTGTYDLSIGAMLSMSLVTTNYLAKHDVVNPVVGALIGLAVCALAGFLSGFVVVKLKVNSFIATLGMSQIATAYIQHTSEQTISGAFKPWYQKLGTREVLGMPLYVYYLAIMAVIVWYVFEHTPSGRYMFATGGNPEAARLAGVRTDRLVWRSLVISAVLAGFAGTIYSFKVGTYASSIGPGFLFPAIAAVFFGASQLKNRPNLWGTLIALFSLATGIKGLQLTFSSNTKWIEPLFQGISLLVAVSLAARSGIIKVPKRKAVTTDTPVATTPAAASS
jgi:ribose transport system permease protein